MRVWFARLLLAFWLLGFVYLTLVWSPIHQPPPNLWPFRSMRHDWREGGPSFWINFVGNFACFLPAGFLLPWALRRRITLSYVAYSALLVSGSVELSQYLSGRRTADVDDVVLNVGGACLGGTLGLTARRALKPAETVGSNL